MQGYNSQMVIQPDMKLGIFATMSTGSSREGPFFTDTITAFAFGLLPKFYDYLVAQPQPSRLPPSPADFVGVYGAEIGGGTTSMHSRPVPMNCVWPQRFCFGSVGCACADIILSLGWHWWRWQALWRCRLAATAAGPSVTPFCMCWATRTSAGHQCSRWLGREATCWK